jgi:serine/threonine protein phosphatase PrpC
VVDALIAEANGRGGLDNITAVLVHVVHAAGAAGQNGAHGAARDGNGG